MGEGGRGEMEGGAELAHDGEAEQGALLRPAADGPGGPGAQCGFEQFGAELGKAVEERQQPVDLAVVTRWLHGGYIEQQKRGSSGRKAAAGDLLQHDGGHGGLRELREEMEQLQQVPMRKVPAVLSRSAP